LQNLVDRLRGNPLIAAVKDDVYLKEALASSCKVLFLLKGNICTIEDIVKQAHEAQKSVYLHLDLIEGFGKDKYALQYIKERVNPNGIITTRAPLVKFAKDFGITVIQRVFLIDNLSFERGIQSIQQVKPDAVEILPGIMPSITEKICCAVSVPVITGGLINEKKDIRDSLKAGAIGVSASTPGIWAYRSDRS
jgi:glycerol uptake operon antiterminator